MPPNYDNVPCKCPKCGARFTDLVGAWLVKRNRNGKPRVFSMECDRCFKARIGEDRYAVYLKWKESVS